jgi:hypothetical protein
MRLHIFIFILLIPFAAHSKSLTGNLLTSEKQIKVVRSFSESTSGIIKTPLCYGCESSELIITDDTQLLVKGIPTKLEDLLTLKLSERSKDIKIQYYRHNMTVNYILWGESELDKRLLQ